jgi:nucleotide-binding universal stress UspA family protein
MRTLETARRIALKNILFATDFSPHANAALPYVLSIANRFGARIYGAYALPAYDYLFVSPEAWPGYIQQEEELREDAVRRLEDQLRGVPHESLFGMGLIWDVLRRFIHQYDIDLVVVGSHGRTGARKLLMGSVAEQIVRQSPCPVLVVGPNVRHQRNSATEFNQVLLATDFGEESQAAALCALSIAQEHQSHLSLVHVQDRVPAKASAPAYDVDSAMQRIRDLVPEDAELQHRPEYYVPSGPPADQILKFCADHGVDLIVMGVHRNSRTVNAVTHFLHTTAQDLVAHAPCPVLMVPRSTRLAAA